MAEGRLGLEVPISGYVTAPDRSLDARAEIVWRQARYQALRIAVRGRRLGRNMQATRYALSERAVWQVIASFRGRIGAVFALLSHLVAREDAVSGATPKPRRRTGLVVVGLVCLAFAAALFIPERVETIPSAEAAAPVEAMTALKAVHEESPVPPLSPANLSPPPLQWQAVRKPIAMYHLESSDIAGLEMSYRVSMRGSSRQDNLIWAPRAEGSSDTRRALAHVIIERHEDRSTTERPLFADLAARAAEQHLIVERMARPQDIRTKFGVFEAAETTIRQDEKVLSCISFRRIDMSGLTLVGWVCGAAQKPVDRVALACFIDRLDLVGGGRDTGLRKVFAEAERARRPCVSSRQSGKRLTWLDHEAPVPDLKLSARGR